MTECDQCSAVLHDAAAAKVHERWHREQRSELEEMKRQIAAAGLFERASGESVCTVCGRLYREHVFAADRDYEGRPFIRQLCDGRRVKL